MVIYKNTQSAIFTICFIFFAASSSYAASATFSWIANSESLSGYKIHYGTSSRNYKVLIDVGLPVAVNGRIIAMVEGLLEGQTYYFAATAYTETEESDYSVEVIYTIPGSVGFAPQIMRIDQVK